jgi:hypothetical protein
VRREATGILMQAVWVLLLLAMVSYDAKDTADWASGATSTVNYIGPVGAWAAWVFFNVFGLVGFLVPLALAVWGLIMVVQSGERIWPRVLWMLAILVGLCVLVDLQSGFWNEWLAERLNLNRMPGGLVGYFLGRMLLTNFLGIVGAAIISVGVVVGGMFFVSQTHPAALWGAMAGFWVRLQERREEWAAGRRTAQEQAEREARLLEKERLKLERELERERRLREKDDRRREKDDEKRAREEAIRREQEETQQREREASLQREKEEAERKAAFLKRLMEQRKAEEEKKADAARLAAQAQAEAERSVPFASHPDEASPAAPWVLPPMSLLQPIPEGASLRAGATSWRRRSIRSAAPWPNSASRRK